MPVLGVFFLVSCYKDNFRKLHPGIAASNAGCDTLSPISYSAQIVPIINDNCINCHNAGGTLPDLSSYSGVQGATMGKVDKLYGSVVWDGTASQMPKGSSVQIPVCDIRKIKKWIDQGTPNN